MRDVDELLDSVVSRRATEAAQTPDFAAIERRGRQRRRRARAMAVGSVAAVVAVIGVAGTRVAQDSAAPEPADQIRKFDGPNGELERAVEAGRAEAVSAAVGADGSTLTIWTRFVLDKDGVTREQYGFGLQVGDEMLWSPFEPLVGLGRFEWAVSPLPDGGFVVDTSQWSDGLSVPAFLVTPDGLRALEIRSAPADLTGGEYDWFVRGVDRSDSGQIYAVDVETSSLAPVAELAGLRPAWMPYFHGFAQTPDGDAWVVTWLGTHLVRMAGDGTVTRYPFAGRPVGLVASDGRSAVLSSEDGRLLLATIVEDGRTATRALWRSPRARGVENVRGAAVLPDGRLLVHTGGTMLRSTDSSWRGADDLGVVAGLSPARFATFTLQQAGDRACLVPQVTQLGGPMLTTEAYCTEDGETWEPVDLAP
jgi:hypothetical protein